MATIKQKRAAKIKLEDPTKSMGQVMLEAGYAPNSTIAPAQNLTESKGWNELMEHYLPDDHLGEKHREFLDSPRIVRTYKKGELLSESEETSPEAVKALDMAYKLKHRYGELNLNQAFILNISESAVKKYDTDQSAGKDIERHA